MSMQPIEELSSQEIHSIFYIYSTQSSNTFHQRICFVFVTLSVIIRKGRMSQLPTWTCIYSNFVMMLSC